MKNVLTAVAMAAVLTVGAAVLGVVAGGRDVSAQPSAKYEYGYIVPAPRLDKFNKEFDEWSGDKAAKDYLKAHVFAFETGDSAHTERLNGLKLMNELAGQGWEIVDAGRGIIRKAK
ncbi:MAG: hypothetical protein IT462_13955 [Planctomycetes bacterium]|nr:hypothetical protein [Planctomycetota bacterium]